MCVCCLYKCNSCASQPLWQTFRNLGMPCNSFLHVSRHTPAICIGSQASFCQPQCKSKMTTDWCATSHACAILMSRLQLHPCLTRSSMMSAVLLLIHVSIFGFGVAQDSQFDSDLHFSGHSVPTGCYPFLPKIDSCLVNNALSLPQHIAHAMIACIDAFAGSCQANFCVSQAS